jgi:hypothetical protein
MCVLKCFPQAHNFRTVDTASCLLACDRHGVSVTFGVSSQVMQRALQLNVYNYSLAAYCVVGLAEGLNSFGGRGVFAWLLLTAVWLLTAV